MEERAPLASIGAVTAMILFVYGMVGWILFGDELPEQWGNIGRAMLTLFVMLTLEDFPMYMDAAMDVEPWAGSTSSASSSSPRSSS